MLKKYHELMYSEFCCFQISDLKNSKTVRSNGGVHISRSTKFLLKYVTFEQYCKCAEKFDNLQHFDCYLPQLSVGTGFVLLVRIERRRYLTLGMKYKWNFVPFQ